MQDFAASAISWLSCVASLHSPSYTGFLFIIVDIKIKAVNLKTMTEYYQPLKMDPGAP